MVNLPEFLESINSRFPAFQGTFRFDEPMANHTTFKVGGPADLWVRPEGEFFPEYASVLLESAKKEQISVFIMGGGANLVVSDGGIRGIVLDTRGYCGVKEETATGFIFRSGTTVDEAVEIAAARGLSGLEFLAGMPGSLGGALWMNARCYEREMSDVVSAAEILADGTIQKIILKKKDFTYKKSPFQGKKNLILGCIVKLEKGDSFLIRSAMESHRKDREEKGHYRFPCAGSAFKNNRAFGKPTGKIIDELGMKGFAVGDAQIAPWHGNIIINRGGARAADIKELADKIMQRVHDEAGLMLEPEILFVGDWP
jgi:UDP-N-acetylmuramate dehydrogenase